MKITHSHSRLFIPALLAALLGSSASVAQETEPTRNWLLDVRIGIVDPRDNPGAIDIDTGATSGGSLTRYIYDSRVGAYIGIDIDAFDADRAGATDDESLLRSTLSLGLAFRDAFFATGLDYHLRLGVLSGHLSIIDDDDDSDVIDETDWGTGWEALIALSWQTPLKMAAPISVQFGYRFAALSAEFDTPGNRRDSNLDA